MSARGANRLDVTGVELLGYVYSEQVALQVENHLSNTNLLIISCVTKNVH